MRKIARGRMTGAHVLRPPAQRIAPEASSPLGLQENEIYHTEGLQEGGLPAQLWDVLQELGYEKEPMYVGEKTSDSDGYPAWNVKVKVYRPHPEPEHSGCHVVSAIYHASGPRATFFNGIADAARHALLDVCSQNSEALADTQFAFLPQRAHGTTHVTLPAEEENTLFGKFVALSVELNSEVDIQEEELKYLRAKIARAQRRLRAIRRNTTMTIQD